jgi:hypothetical protein
MMTTYVCLCGIDNKLDTDFARQEKNKNKYKKEADRTHEMRVHQSKFPHRSPECICNRVKGEVPTNYKMCRHKHCRVMAMITAKYCFEHVNEYRTLNGKQPFPVELCYLGNLLKRAKPEYMYMSTLQYLTIVCNLRYLGQPAPMNVLPYPKWFKHSSTKQMKYVIYLRISSNLPNTLIKLICQYTSIDTHSERYLSKYFASEYTAMDMYCEQYLSKYFV